MDIYRNRPELTEIQKVLDLASKGALFVISHSGGKDSQAMFHMVRQLVPAEQIVIVHATLGRLEWAGTWEHVVKTTEGFPSYQIQAIYGRKAAKEHGRAVGSVKTLFDMVKGRRMWPAAQQRQCTSDLKRGPIEKQVRHILKARKLKLVVDCQGLRAEESSDRAAKATWQYSRQNSKGGRSWYVWLPIHKLTTCEVFDIIKRAGQQPHWVYAAGMSRASCCFCILSNKADLITAAKLNPALYADYVKLERDIGHTHQTPNKKTGAKKTLEQLTGIAADLSLATV